MSLSLNLIIFIVALTDLQGVFPDYCPEDASSYGEVFQVCESATKSGNKIYIDTRNVPADLMTECKCRVENVTATTSTITYSAPFGQQCGVSVSFSNITYNCTGDTITYPVSISDITFRLLSTSSNRQACLTIIFANTASQSVTCYGHSTSETTQTTTTSGSSTATLSSQNPGTTQSSINGTSTAHETTEGNQRTSNTIVHVSTTPSVTDTRTGLETTKNNRHTSIGIVSTTSTITNEPSSAADVSTSPQRTSSRGQQKQENNSQVVLIAAVGGGVVLVLVVAVTAICCIRHRRAKRASKSASGDDEVMTENELYNRGNIVLANQPRQSVVTSEIEPDYATMSMNSDFMEEVNTQQNVRTTDDAGCPMNQKYSTCEDLDIGSDETKDRDSVRKPILTQTQQSINPSDLYAVVVKPKKASETNTVPNFSRNSEPTNNQEMSSSQLQRHGNGELYTMVTKPIPSKKPELAPKPSRKKAHGTGELYTMVYKPNQENANREPADTNHGQETTFKITDTDANNDPLHTNESKDTFATEPKP